MSKLCKPLQHLVTSLTPCTRKLIGNFQDHRSGTGHGPFRISINVIGEMLKWMMDIEKMKHESGFTQMRSSILESRIIALGESRLTRTGKSWDILGPCAESSGCSCTNSTPFIATPTWVRSGYPGYTHSKWNLNLTQLVRFF